MAPCCATGRAGAEVFPLPPFGPVDAPGTIDVHPHFMSGNARRWMGIDRQGVRLAAFFGDHPAWTAVGPP
ncbi:hypothetical protein [Paracoccus haematequi]|uniref:hypothetical protein n=1 Tax=Paracoccus haematequi TaxID=2491866 RepID=UPI000F7DD971|nr:hypothetical protein [Paracoccus haematequi]